MCLGVGVCVYVCAKNNTLAVQTSEHIITLGNKMSLEGGKASLNSQFSLQQYLW